MSVADCLVLMISREENAPTADQYDIFRCAAQPYLLDLGEDVPWRVACLSSHRREGCPCSADLQTRAVMVPPWQTKRAQQGTE